jgi:hypothetical protein
MGAVFLLERMIKAPLKDLGRINRKYHQQHALPLLPRRSDNTQPDLKT